MGWSKQIAVGLCLFVSSSGAFAAKGGRKPAPAPSPTPTVLPSPTPAPSPAPAPSPVPTVAPSPSPTPVATVTPTLPSAHSIYMPPVVNQGSEGSCTAVAVAYARSAEQYYHTGAAFYDPAVNIFSPEYLYNQTTTDTTNCGAGSGLITALNFLISNGIDTWASMPYTWTNGCSLMPSGAQTQEASQYRISSYTQIAASDTTAIKSALAGNHPLTLYISIDNEFYNAGAGFVWMTAGQVVGYHTMTVVGYDDSRHAWKFMNSFGTSWGDSGYSWVDYDLLPKVGSALMKINL